MHQPYEGSQAKRKISSSINSHLSGESNRRRHKQQSQTRKEPVRRAWSHGLPSLATNTVQMVVATLQLTPTMNDVHDARVSMTEPDDIDEEEDRIANLGQQVQAYIPDIVLNNLNDLIDKQGRICIPNEHTYDNGTLLFLDVSGFTSLTEQYSNDPHLGIDQLTRALNSYFDKLVYEILTHGGDIYKFAGDAILALWTNEQTGPSRALKCALHLQQKCGAYETDFGVILRLKVALAYGHVRALFVGTEEFKHYLLTGDCVKNVNICEQLCEPGDIIITRAVYERLALDTFDCEFNPLREHADGQDEHVVVKYKPSSRRSSCDENEIPLDTEEHLDPETLLDDRMEISTKEITAGNPTNGMHGLCTDELSLKIGLLMNSFLLNCVYQRIERKQSLEYLSELRRVTISFINLDIDNEKSVEKNLHQNLQKIFVHIYELTKMMGGVLTKGLLFDKGWSFLCVFGLPGYKQGDDTANALKSAQLIHTIILNECPFVQKCSIGVTTGLTYCGVVGHVARCEYTVIGRKVNMAARLMCNYPNIISCDQETYYNSRLNSRFFRILPDKTLKGMNNVGLIWRYGDYRDLPPIVESKAPALTPSQTINDTGNEDYPLLGRRVELMIVATHILLLDEPIGSVKRRRDIAAIIFEGEDKVGRSRLLHYIGHCLENSNHVHSPSIVAYYDSTYIPTDLSYMRVQTGIANEDKDNGVISSLNAYGNDCSTVQKPLMQVINYRCQFEQRFIEFGLLRSLLKQLLQFHTNDRTESEREQYLLRLFDVSQGHDLHLRKNLFLLNDLLDVRFRRSRIDMETGNDQNLVQTYENNLNELLFHILDKLIDSSNQIADTYASTIVPNGPDTIGKQYRLSLDSSTTVTPPSTVPLTSKIIFIVDDIHFADESSLKHLLTLGSHRKCLLILSMKPPNNNNNDRPTSNTMTSIRTDSRVYRRMLPGLELRYLATLGCQMLSVHRLPNKLVKVFNESCSGIPGFCEQILLDLLSKDKIYIVDDDASHDQDSTLSSGDPEKLLLNTPDRLGLVKTFFSQRKQSISDEQRKEERAFSRQCLLRSSGENDFNADCQQNFQNYIMCRIDRLSEGESLLVKIAAVIGNTFSRIFLWHLVDSPSKQLININSCILDMMQRALIECGYAKQQINRMRSISCFCLQNPTGFPSHCRLMAFTHSTIREGIYNSLTDGLKRQLIRNAIDYLEKQCPVVCLTCGASRNDSPFLVHDQDGLAKIMKNRQQHALVDIVQIAALKEIDNTIKQLADALNRPRSITSSHVLSDPSGDSSDFENLRVKYSAAQDSNLHRATSEADVVEFQRSTTIPSLNSSPEVDGDGANDDKMEMKVHSKLRRNSSDPNLTLISLYSSETTPVVQVNVQRSTSSAASHASELFSLFKLPKRAELNASIPNSEKLQSAEGLVRTANSMKNDTIVEASKTSKTGRRRRFLSFVRYFFCQLVSMGSHATVTPTNDPPMIDGPQLESTSSELSPSTTVASVEPPPNVNNERHAPSAVQDIGKPLKPSAHWLKVRKAVLRTRNKNLRSLPSEHELLGQSIFSPERMEKLSGELKTLKNQIHLTRNFESLYQQSVVFHTFQSHVQHTQLLQYAYEMRLNDTSVAPDLNIFASEFSGYTDLRVCECVDYVMTVYVKLVEYHTHFYDMYEKAADEKRDHLRLKQFDRIMYYRMEICQIFLRCNCLQRLLVEIENGRRFLQRFLDDMSNQEDFIYHYHYLLVHYRYNLFQAIVLQRNSAAHDAQQLCEQSLTEINQAYQEKIWEKFIVTAEPKRSPSAQEKRELFEHTKGSPSEDCSSNFSESTQSSMSSTLDPLFILQSRYRLEYLLCQYHLLRHNLSRQHVDDSVQALLELQYHTFPIVFSLPCTIALVEYFYCRMNYPQCLLLIEKIVQFWWSFLNARERLELAKLKCLSLIIELKQGAFDSAIISGYFAKRILTGYHENTFLIESCIYLTLALIGEMRISHIELVLQHLEYLGEQTMNCYAKLWYYILAIDVAIELGYEILPITVDLLDNIAKYRKKLQPGSNQRSLLLIYSDCILAQIYARLGLIDRSKIHFHQVLHQIKFEQMHLSHIDFRFKRVLLKLVEVQLLHWYHNKDTEEHSTKEHFLLNYLNEFNNEEFLSWNKTRFLIYQAYYDRLVNDYRREQGFPVDNEFNWQNILEEAEPNAIKLDLEWIKQLKNAWSHTLAWQMTYLPRLSISSDNPRRSVTGTKHIGRRCLRPTVPQQKNWSKNEPTTEKPLDEHDLANNDTYSRQKFLDWRLGLATHHTAQFHLYVLPVRV